MSPTIFRESGFRFYFFSREEVRLHVHVHGANGEAKFWLDPKIELAQNYWDNWGRISLFLIASSFFVILALTS
jgi:hypothetical protein